MDVFSRSLFADEKSLEQLAQEQGLSIEETLDRLLLSLWDALFLTQCEGWTADNVANLSSDEALELARWWLKGQSVGSKPLFDGICSMCGTLLHDLSNGHRGDPVNRDGNPLLKPNGEPDVDAQPPFLLSFSPAFFAKEVPAVFQHDPATNSLSLRDGVDAPWIASSQTGVRWHYCKDCAAQWLGKDAKKAHIPFRDKASQHFMKAVYRKPRDPAGTPRSSTSTSTQPEPDPEDFTTDGYAPHAGGQQDAGEVYDDDVPLDIPELVRQYPTLDEYKAKWERLKNHHSRTVAGVFSRDNLVPDPNSQLWQDCPYVPFEDLVSAEAQARLSVCRPHSSLEEASCSTGVPRYSHITGDVCYRRRAPLQLSSMLGFLLNDRSGRFLRLTPKETDALHEILTWGRQPGKQRDPRVLRHDL